jgi:Lon protease-like protein
VIELPLFPLRSVLCPGVALPLHIFESRYRLMVNRCIDRGEPFGVVLLREGREVGPARGEIAAVGTTAVIRRAGTYPDGRLDILTVGQQRFRLEAIDHDAEPYLVGRVVLLDEPTGSELEAAERARGVGRRFLQYLELLQPEGVDDGPEIEIEFELEVEEGEAPDDDEAVGDEPSASGTGGPEPEPLTDLPVAGSERVEAAEALVQDLDASDLSSTQRRELLMAAARRLTSTDDPTALSYVLTALIQVDLGARQSLLEAPDTVERLIRLDGLLGRESWFLKQGLRPIIVEPDSGVRPRG